jgi:hypothetical protein
VFNGTSASSPVIYYVLLPLLEQHELDQFYFKEPNK